MKTKFLLGFLLTAILLTVMVSAANTFTVTAPDVFDQGKPNITFSVTDISITGVTLDPFSPFVIDGENGYSMTFAITGNLNISPSATEVFTITPNSQMDYSKFILGKIYSKDVTVSDGNASNDELITVEIEKTFCKNGIQRSDLLEIDDIGIDVRGFSEEDNEWYPLDEIEVEVTVDNVHTDDIDDIVVEWCLYSQEKDKCIVEEEEDDFKLKDGKDKDVLIAFQLEPDDLDENVNDYTLYIKVYSDDADYGEDALCIEEFESIEIMRAKDFVTINDVVIPEIVSCGTDLEVRAEVWNIGDEDVADVYAIIYNKELEINERIEIGDIDMLEEADRDLSFVFKVPEDAEEGNYFLDIKIYDEDDDLFENENEDESEFSYIFKIEGNCIVEGEEPDVLITVDPDQEYEAVAGEEVTINIDVENTGEEAVEFDVVISGFQSWGSEKEVSPRTIELDAEESEEVSISLLVNEDITSDWQSFSVKILSDGKEVAEKEIELYVEGKEGVSLTGATIAEHLRKNWFIWVIVVINIILIIAIIAVARRIATTR